MDMAADDRSPELHGSCLLEPPPFRHLGYHPKRLAAAPAAQKSPAPDRALTARSIETSYRTLIRGFIEDC
jgi:hypothetical protein